MIARQNTLTNIEYIFPRTLKRSAGGSLRASDLTLAVTERSLFSWLVRSPSRSFLLSSLVRGSTCWCATLAVAIPSSASLISSSFWQHMMALFVTASWAE